MNDIIIYGTGGLGRGVVDLIHEINKNGTRWNIIGFIDDNEKKVKVNGIDVLGTMECLKNTNQRLNVVLAIGAPEFKMKVYKELSILKNIYFPNLMHPSVEFSHHNTIGKGNIIGKGATLSTNIDIGDFNLIHYNCTIGHDVVLGNFNSIYPLTAISGFVNIEDNIVIGTNSSIIPNVLVGENSIIGAGSAIIKNVNSNSKVVGVPGKTL